MSIPVISIIVPCYNVEQYIDECLYSLTNQTINNIEIICVEDGSLDGTLDKLTKWKDKDTRIRIVKHEENKGVGTARNTGIKAAKADYIAFVDSDDYVSKNKYEYLYNLSNNGNVDLVVSSQFIRHDEKDIIITQIPQQITGIGNIRRHVLTHGFPIWNSIIKKSIIFQNDLFFPNRLIYEDNAVSTCFFLCAKAIAVYYGEPLHYYRKDNYTSITEQKGNLTFFNRLETAILFYNNTKRLGFYNQYKDEIEYAFFYLFYKNTVLGSLKKFNNHPPASVIKTIPKRYRATTSVDIKKNPYYRMNKPQMMVFAIAHFPEFTPIWVYTSKAWNKTHQLLHRINQLLQ